MSSPTKQALFDFFDRKISRKAIQQRGGEWVVVGKTCIISLEPEGVIDIWICNPKDIAAGLGTGAMRNRLELLKKYGNEALQELNGEGWCKTTTKAAVLDNLAFLGIRKKQTYSPEVLAARREWAKQQKAKVCV